MNIAGRIYYETHFAPLLRMQGFFNEVALELQLEDSRRMPVLVNAVERRNQDGTLRFIRMTVFNATDRRRYEHDLLEARSAAEATARELRALNATLELRITQAVEEKLKAEESLRHGQKMEAIGQLTGGVAHDFNNLLTVILGGLESIGRYSSDLNNEANSARIRRAREMAEHGARRAATLTARLLAFSRQQALAPRVVDPNRLIVGLADLLQRSLGETISFETIAGAGVWKAFVDPGELENVLINLAVNARDAMPNGGQLTIETSNAFLDEAYVAAITEPVSPGQYVLIAVSDTGHGMSADVVEKVFEPYFTTKEVGKGTGLGLSHVYGFVRQSEGHVRIYSEVGEGTTIKVYLPRALNENEVVEPSGVPSKIDEGNETVLVVEDDEELRAYSVGILKELGYTALEARSAAAALQVLESNGDTALIFTDVVLPGGMTGRALADEARKRRPDLKILFTTGYTRNAIVHQGRLDPNVNLLPKPFTFRELALKVRALLDQR